MACQTCGDCSYDTISTADLSQIVTVGGPRQCAAPSSVTAVGIPYLAPGVWEQRTSGGQLQFRVIHSCVASPTWTYTIVPAGGSGIPPNCEEIPVEVTSSLKADDCENFRFVVLTTYSDGSWVKVDTTIAIGNNANCS